MTKNEVYEKMILYKQKLNITKDNYDSLKLKLKSSEKETKNMEEALKVLNKFMDISLKPKINFLEESISSGLKFIFGKNYEFKIINEIKNNKNVYYFKLNMDDISGDIDSSGGGVMAVISFLIRLNINVMENKYKLMILDESLNHLSESYQENLSNFIKIMCKKFDTNIIMVTHQPKMSIHADVVYDFKKVNNVLKYNLIKNNVEK